MDVINYSFSIKKVIQSIKWWRAMEVWWNRRRRLWAAAAAAAAKWWIRWSAMDQHRADLSMRCPRCDPKLKPTVIWCPTCRSASFARWASQSPLLFAEQFQSSSRAVSEQLQCSFSLKSVPEQFQSSFSAVSVLDKLKMIYIMINYNWIELITFYYLKKKN